MISPEDQTQMNKRKWLMHPITIVGFLLLIVDVLILQYYSFMAPTGSDLDLLEFLFITSIANAAALSITYCFIGIRKNGNFDSIGVLAIIIIPAILPIMCFINSLMKNQENFGMGEPAIRLNEYPEFLFITMTIIISLISSLAFFLVSQLLIILVNKARSQRSN